MELSITTLLVGILGIAAILYFYWLLARILYILYPDFTRAVRRGAFLRIFVASVVINILSNIPTLVNAVVSLLPPGWFA